MTRIVILSETAAATPKRPGRESELLLQGEPTPEQIKFAEGLKRKSPRKILKAIEIKVRARNATLTRNLAAKEEQLLAKEGELAAARTEADVLREELATAARRRTEEAESAEAKLQEQQMARDAELLAAGSEASALREELEATRRRASKAESSRDKHKKNFETTLGQKSKLLTLYAECRVAQADAAKGQADAAKGQADAAEAQAR
jgi:chromosome segregation ATPase